MKHQTNISSDTVTSDTYKKISKNQKWIKGIYSFRITGATLAQWMNRKPHVARPKSGGLGSNPIPALCCISSLSFSPYFPLCLSSLLHYPKEEKTNKKPENNNKKVFELS